MEQVVARLSEKAAQEIRSRLAQEIQVLRFRVCKGNPVYSNLLFASRSKNGLITGSHSNLLDLLAAQANGEMRYGTAPPNAAGRSLGELLDRLGDGNNGGGRDHD